MKKNFSLPFLLNTPIITSNVILYCGKTIVKSLDKKQFGIPELICILFFALGLNRFALNCG